jgi:hypothetical protein
MKIVNNRLVKFKEIEIEIQGNGYKYIETFRRYNGNHWVLMEYDEEHQLIDSKIEELEKIYQEYKSSTPC